MNHDRYEETMWRDQSDFGLPIKPIPEEPVLTARTAAVAVFIVFLAIVVSHWFPLGWAVLEK